MATRTTKAAAAPITEPTEIPPEEFIEKPADTGPQVAEGESGFAGDPLLAAGTHPPQSAFRQVWVFHYNTALAANQVGFVLALRDDAQTMIDNGDAVDPYTTHPLPFIGKADAPAPSPPPAPPPEPEEFVTLLSFTQAGPTVSEVSTDDAAKLEVGGTLTLQGTSGSPGAQGAIHGRTVPVTAIDGTTVTIDIDLSSVEVDGLAGTGLIVPEPVEPPAPPAPAPEPPAPPPPEGPAPNTAVLSSFMAGNPTWAQGVDPGEFMGNRQITLSNVQGDDPEVAALLEGQTVSATVSHGGMRFNLQGIDTTGRNVAGLTCTATEV